LNNVKVIKPLTGLFFLNSEDLIQFTSFYNLYINPAKTLQPISCLNIPVECRLEQKNLDV